MRNIKNISVLAMMLLIAAVTLRADFNPANPPEPGPPEAKVKLWLKAEPSEAGYFNIAAETDQRPGSSVSLRAYSRSGWTFTDWRDSEGKSVSTDPTYIYIVPAKASSLTARYTYNPGNPAEPSVPSAWSRLTVGHTPADGGSVSPSGTGRYNVGAAVNLRAYPASGFLFDGWYDSDGAKISSQTAWTYTVTEADASLTARFRYSPDSPAEPSPVGVTRTLTLKVEPANGGYLSSSSPLRLAEGADVSVRAYPNTGFRFKGWRRDGRTVTTDPLFSFTMPESDAEAVAVFEYNPDSPAEPAEQPSSVHAYGKLLSAVPGSTVNWPVYLENKGAEITGLTVIVTVPEDVTMYPDAVTAGSRASAHTVGYETVDSHTIQYQAIGTAPFAGANGVVLNIPMSVSADRQPGESLGISLTKATVTNADGSQARVNVKNGGLTVVAAPDDPIPSPDLVVEGITLSGASDINPGNQLTIGWSVANKGQLPALAGWTERVSLVDASGRSASLGVTGYTLDSELMPGGRVSRQATFVVPSLPGVDGAVKARVTLVPEAAAGESEEARLNNTSESAGTVTLGKALTLTVPVTEIMENAGGLLRCQLSRSGNWSRTGSFNLDIAGDGRLQGPATVEIPRNQSAAIFYLSVKDNSINDLDGLHTLTVSGEGYGSVSHEVKVIDDELPEISLDSSAERLGEGEEAELTLSLQRAPASDLTVTLRSDQSKRLKFPATAVIAAGTTVTRVKVRLTDDAEVQPETIATIEAVAEGYSSGEAYITLVDNDVPELELTLTPEMVSEDAGTSAVVATVRRLTNLSRAVTVNIGSDAPRGALYLPVSVLKLEAGQESAEFSIGVTDNSVVDGDRTYHVTAAVYAGTCGCTMSQGATGHASATLTVTDNDGPALTLTPPASSTLREGTTGHRFAVSRNTENLADAVSVSVTSDDPRLIIPERIVMASGARTTYFNVDVASNNDEADNRTVSLRADADGFSPGSCWVQISDATLPDAVVTGITVNPESPKSAGEMTVEVAIANNGVALLPEATPVSLRFSLYSEPRTLYTRSALAPGESETISTTYTLPLAAGEHTLRATVNPDRTVHELVYVNNTSDACTVTIKPGYTATARVDKPVYRRGETVRITGVASGAIEPGGLVEVYVVNAGQRDTELVEVKEDLSYSYDYILLGLRSGHFIAGACFPDERLVTPMAEFDVYGMEVSKSKSTSQFDRGEKAMVTFTLSNPGALPLSGIHVEHDALPDGMKVEVEAPASLGAGASGEVNVTVSSDKPTDGTDWQLVKLRLVSSEGAEAVHTLYLYVNTPEARMRLSESSVQATVTKGTTREVSFTIINQGKGETGPITVDTGSLSWLRSVTPTTLPSLAYGECATVTLALTASASMQLNNPVWARVGINCRGGDGVAYQVQMEPVSEETGVLTVDVCDEYTYYTADAPHVAGATVSVQHPVTRAVITSGITDSDGRCSFTLPEGYYYISVTESKHESFGGTLLVNPGVTTYRSVNIGVQAIKVDITYEPTEIEDTYEVETEVKFETEVPVPVVETVMPKRIYAEELAVGESLMFNAVMTNKGLITARRVSLNVPERNGVFLMQVLHEQDFDIAPQQSVTIPVKVTRLPEEEVNLDKVHSAVKKAGEIVDVFEPFPGVECVVYNQVVYYSACGEDERMHRYSTTMQMTKCSGPVAPRPVEPTPVPDPLPSIGGGPSWELGGGGSVDLGSFDFNVCDRCVQAWLGILYDTVGYDPEHPVRGAAEQGVSTVAGWLEKDFGLGCIMDVGNNIYDGITSGEPDFGELGEAGLGCAVEACEAITDGIIAGGAATLQPEVVAGAEIVKKACQIAGLIPDVMDIWDNCNHHLKNLAKKAKDKIKDVVDDIVHVFSSPDDSFNGTLHASVGKLYNFDDEFEVDEDDPSLVYPDFIRQYQEKTRPWYDYMVARGEFYDELLHFDEMKEASNSDIARLMTALKGERDYSPELWAEVRPSNVSEETFARWLELFGNTQRLSDGETVVGETLDTARMNEALKAMAEFPAKVRAAGYADWDEMLADATAQLVKGYEQASSNVCASISLKISQTVTMTRQAVRATLDVHNGHASEPMKDVVLEFSVIDDHGAVVGSNIMAIAPEKLDGFTGELSLTSGWSLEAGKDGQATILFIPTRYAAEEASRPYTFTGTISYLDPFSGTTVKRDLTPATLTVNPSPVLDLTYFMQRDVLADDPLTAERVEPTEASEFALVISNKGHGDATSLRMVTRQPQIVSNEKGLLVDFSIVSSQLAGQDKVLSLGQSVASDFGILPAQSSTHAQWWIESSLMGHFVDYDVKANHLTSYGNEDLSLLDQVSIHELIHGFTPMDEVKSLDPMATVGPRRAFLVNDIADVDDAPDAVYVSDRVDEPATLDATARAVVSRVSDSEYLLTLTPSLSGWCYGVTADPTAGRRKLVSVTRRSDGAEVPLDNVWSTYVTLRDAADPLYENRLHAVAYSAQCEPVAYLLRFAEVPDVTLDVEEISGSFEAGKPVTEPVRKLKVTFNKDIDASTFTSDDMLLTCGGVRMPLKEAAVTPVDGRTYELGLDGLTESDGYYTFTVDASGITDADGFTGKTGRSVSWTQLSDGKVSFIAVASPPLKAALCRRRAAAATPEHQ